MLFENLFKSRNDVKKSLATAITIQSIYKNDLKILIKLFDFFVETNQLDSAFDLCEKELFKNFNLNETNLLDFHLNKFGNQIIGNFKKKSSNNLTVNSAQDEFYFKLFLKFGQQSQEVLVKKLLDKYHSQFLFLKTFVENSTKQSQMVGQQSAQTIDIKQFYLNLAENCGNFFIMRDLLLIYPKFIPEYGLFFIDGFLNVEKHLLQTFANLVQKNISTQLSSNLINIEKRSLNLMRRICIIDLIPEFVHLIDKLDNRHCYRWIEKSLEFFSKYVINTLEVTLVREETDDLSERLKFNYSSIKLLYDSELLVGADNNENLNTDHDEKIIFIKEHLKDLIEYKYQSSASDNNTNPFYHVYRLLDEIGKKTWLANYSKYHGSVNDSDRRKNNLFAQFKSKK
jgi:hypothetical protein